MGVARTRWLLSHLDPVEAVAAILAGTLPPELPAPTHRVDRSHLDKWRGGLREQDVDELVARNVGGSQQILDAGHRFWPFGDDVDPPVLLFARGRLDCLAEPRRVAIVGTRRCSAIGRSVAGEMGWTLAEHGVAVVSGLALGIDGAAHRGAGASATDPGRIGVVASGLDMIYPPRNEQLWNDVAHTGVVISETPMGERATRWRFPARNRLIAGLSELVVVVESHERGGALITVDEALRRAVEVVAVPGSVLGRSCVGTNQLLMDGVPPVRNGQDLVDVLGVRPPEGPQLTIPTEGGQGSNQPKLLLSAPEQAILDALDAGPVMIEDLAKGAELDVSETLTIVQRLRRQELVAIDGAEVAIALDGGQ